MNYNDEYEKIINKYQYVGLTTLVRNKDKVYISTHGYQNLETKEKIDENTIFRIASISKVVVALGIMKLYEEGKLDIKEDISKYLGYHVRNPYFPNNKITLEMLMTQTSSISDGNDNSLGYDGVNGPLIDVKLQDLLTNKEYKYYYEKTFKKFVPGTHFEYSNFGCGVLACIIEKVSGMYFSDYIREKILLPLDIDGSYRIFDIINKDKVASLYGYKNNQFEVIRNLQMFLDKEYPKYELGNNFRMAAGGLFISIKDLDKIMNLLMNEGFPIFKNSTIKYMKEIHWQGISDDPQYKKKGLQLLILDGYGETLYGHFGDAYGLRSYMLFNNKRGYIFLCNGANFNYITSKGITDIQEDSLQFMVKYEGD